MKRSRGIMFGGFGVLVVAAVGIGFLIDGTANAPLVGTTVHDFGESRYQGAMVKLSHEFNLVNESTRPVRILGITSTCGCTTGTVTQEVVEPGATLVVPAVFTLGKTGKSQETLWLQLEGIGTMPLTLIATARSTQRMAVHRRAVRLVPGETSRVSLTATDTISDLMPIEPTIVSPPGVTAVFEGWNLVFPRDEAKDDRPARWDGVVSVALIGTEPLPRDATLTVKWDDERIAEVGLTGRAWH